MEGGGEPINGHEAECELGLETVQSSEALTAEDEAQKVAEQNVEYAEAPMEIPLEMYSVEDEHNQQSTNSARQNLDDFHQLSNTDVQHGSQAVDGAIESLPADMAMFDALPVENQDLHGAENWPGAVHEILPDEMNTEADMWNGEGISIYETHFPDAQEKEDSKAAKDTAEDEAKDVIKDTAKSEVVVTDSEEKAHLKRSAICGSEDHEQQGEPFIESLTNSAKRPRLKSTDSLSQAQGSPTVGENESSGGQKKSKGKSKDKKNRLIWTPELHERFVTAINSVGIQNAVPKAILQLMNVPDLTTEHVKSHLQKYRNNLKKEATQENQLTTSNMGPVRVLARQAISMPGMVGQVPGQPLPNVLPNTHRPGIAVPSHHETMRFIEWQMEVHDKTMRFLLQMQLNHHHSISLQRKIHVTLERHMRTQAQNPHAASMMHDPRREYSALLPQQTKMQDNLNEEMSCLRKIVQEQEEICKSFMKLHGLANMSHQVHEGR
eukprot:CAMPEP_0198735260 /NCGR_PEP_ID=MMETSP1475-20131203/58217_1 /TAXON_ID= ORGANISM="Unidentified sp., Strain CCMP1999" /NCGR_SAMPLE_ID=MMETSP1475 /ASSEMBLY_ACC=CAM_ASM_001111 /LENGTH=492 /DNA_ID=CAMNT_0044498885 /DNA_START=134 /DNA_END=1612 /DNA_ORIENTATION=-